MKEKKVLKQSLLIGALTSSFGVFISKALGLIYYSPLSAMAGEENMAFYSITYTYYDILLKISSAGIPFAIAALVAKYVAKEDYKTAKLVRKLGTSLVMALSFICVFFFVVFATPLAEQSMGELASETDIRNLKILFYILLIAVILVPYLSALRSYYQGLKRLDLFASSQVLEQLVRVLTIVGLGYLCVTIFKLDNIWAIYMAIAAAGIAALVAIIFFKLSTKKDDEHMEELLASQQDEGITKKEVFKEIVSMGVPYLLISIFGTGGPLINTTFFLQYVTKDCGMPINEAKLALGILQANCSKLNAIPQTLTSGFCAGIVPYLTESYQKNEIDKIDDQILKLLRTLLFILIPVLFVFFFFAKEIYYIMYGGANIELGASLFRASTAIGFTETVLPVFSSIMITLRLKKESVLTLICVSFVKFITFFICVKYMYAYGMIASTSISSIVGMFVYIYILNRKYNVKFKSLFKLSGLMLLSSLIMALIPAVINYFVNFEFNSRLTCMILMCGYGLLMVLIYYFATLKLGIIKKVFNMQDPSISKILKRFKM